MRRPDDGRSSRSANRPTAAALAPRAEYAGRWFGELVFHLLAGSPAVLDLVGLDGVPPPFRPPEGRPPRWLRVRRFSYDFAPAATAAAAGAAPVLAKLLTDPEIEDAGARKHAAALLKSMAAADARGVAAALQCDADRVVIGLEIDQRLATKPVDTMRRSTSQKTLAAMMRRLTPKSSSSKKNVVTK